MNGRAATTAKTPGKAGAERRVGLLSLGSQQEETRSDGGQDLKLLARLWPFLRPDLFLLVLSLVLIPVATLASTVQPMLVGRAIDAAIVDHSSDALRQIVLLFAAAIVADAIGRFAQTYAMQLAGQRAMARVRADVFKHVQGIRVAYFDRTPVGRIVTRVTNDVDTMSELFGSGAVTALADILMLAGIIGFMAWIDWELCLVTMIAVPPLLLVVNAFRHRARDAFRAIRAKIAQLNAYLAEQVQGVAVVQAFGREAACAAEYAGINDDYRHAHLRAIRYDALLYSVVESISSAVVAVVLWYASVRAGWVDEGSSAAYVGTFVAFYQYIERFFVPIRDLSGKYTIIQSSLASAERIFGLLDTDEPDAATRAPEGEAATQAGPETGGPLIAFRDVTFAYRTGHPVLRDVNLEVQRGSTVALVGATGSGKTTLTALLLRMHAHEQGQIFFDGREIRTYGRTDLRRRFAVVPQDVFLFSGTILENIALGERQPDPDKAQIALEQVGAWDLVQSRGGLTAPVDERGANYSAGERQLLAFARALYRDPEVLVLDEATANIDSETEARLQRAVLTLIAGRTSIVIAHRLSTIRHADEIVVMQRGRIVEAGAHDALIEAGGVYAQLHRLQVAEQGEAGAAE